MSFFPPGQRVVLASNNPGKLAEISNLLSGLELEIILQRDLQIAEAEETGTSFLENSLIKARHACKFSGLPAIADDSGLEVFALHGEPGVHSARYAGIGTNDEKNNAKLLKALEHVAEKNRQARFHCVVSVLRDDLDETPLVCHGNWDGEIVREPLGTNGFGYDPLFYVAEQQCTSAELPSAIKNKISHRAKAFTQLIEKLQSH